MSPAANLHSVKNRFLLRINNAGREHLRATFPGTFVRDLVVVGACFTVERTSLPALRWLSANRDRLLHELHLYEEKLKTIGRMLEASDVRALENLFAEARAAREKWLKGEYQ